MWTHKQSFQHRKDYLNSAGACFRKQKQLQTSTEKSLLFKLFPRKYRRDKITWTSRNARSFDHATQHPLPCWNSHLSVTNTGNTGAYSNEMLLPHFSFWREQVYAFLFRTKGNGLHRSDPCTAYFWVESGWEVESLGMSPFSSVLNMLVTRISHPSIILDCMSSKPCTCSILLCKSNLGKQKTRKTENEDAQFWILCKRDTTYLQANHMFYDFHDWSDRIIVGVIETIKRSPRDADITQSPCQQQSGIKHICNKMDWQQQKDQQHQFILSNLQKTKCHRWAEKQRSLYIKPAYKH